jgi:hypothetical protein
MGGGGEGAELTCDWTEEAESGRVPGVLVDHPLPRRHWDGNCQRDRLVEFSPDKQGAELEF